MLLYEYASNGSLAAFLATSSSNRTTLSSTRRVKILHDVTQALHYLHSGAGRKGHNTRPCYHRDLKSANICLTESFTAKLIDCGLGKLVDDNNRSIDTFINSSGAMAFGTRGYTCPWYAVGGRRFEAACDVYSLGIIVMEVITGVLQNGQSKRNGKDFGEFRNRYVEDKDRKTIPDGWKQLVKDADPEAGWVDDDIIHNLAKMAVQCCQYGRNERPTTDALVEELSKMGDMLKSSV